MAPKILLKHGVLVPIHVGQQLIETLFQKNSIMRHFWEGVGQTS